MKTKTAILIAALALAGAAAAQQHGHGGHGGHGMSDMSSMHADMEKRMADTSAFGEAGDPKSASRTIAVQAADVRFDVTSIDARLGETIRFEVTNAGEQPHEFAIGDAAYLEAAQAMMAHMAEMGMDLASPEHAAMHGHHGNAVIVRPGETKTVTWRFTKPGEFGFACNMPGHAEAGMTGAIAVK